nr:ABC transporter permease [Bradyrhizobium zhengyangense]
MQVSSQAVRSESEIGSVPSILEGGRKFGAALLALGIALLLLAIWQLSSQYRLVSALILPSPALVAGALYEGVVGGRFLNDILVTFNETVLGFLFGTVVAITLGATFAYSGLLRRAGYPYVIAVQTFPKIAIAPLLIAWFGYGIGPKVIISALLAFFPVFTATLAGFTEVNSDMIDLLRSMKATRLQELRKLRLPFAMAFIVPSLDVAIVLALLGAIAAELVGGAAGLGQVIQQKSFTGDIAAVYAVLALTAAIGISLRSIVRTVTRALQSMAWG